MRIMRLREVISMTGLARSTIYQLIGTGEFPKPVPLVGRSVGWVEPEVQEWIKAKIALRDLRETSSTSAFDSSSAWSQT
ncbi:MULTISPECIES: AlpA family transcriptional regulator [unclassified Pseudomonas]|uniref:AlpA family transcriptional regulator n=1 Tax=unclassified Pseudomonas TaxID=196821 RepID=UPI0009E73F1A|nr:MULTISPECIES: AlpA family transcriptional regulator [unclassified Pseudomonas]